MIHKQITIQDIAEQAGVSKTTVSRYLNGKYDFMSADTRAHIADIISKTGYRPNRLANSLKTNRSGLIGVVMSNVMSTQTPYLLASICDACILNEKKIIIVNSDRNPEKERLLALELLDQKVEGLLVTSGYNPEFYQALDRENIPVVFVDRVPKGIKVDSVSINHAESTHCLIAHLIRQGFERIVLLKNSHRNPNNTIDIRVRAAIETCKEAFGDETHCEIIYLNKISQNNVVSRLEDVTEIIERVYSEREKRRVAIFATEALIMNDVAYAYYRANVKLSKDFTIAGYSDWNSGGRMIMPQISTIEQPLTRMGQVATNKLIRRIEQNGLEDSIERKAEYLSCHITLADICE